MKTHELGKRLLAAPNGDIECSVDILAGLEVTGKLFGNFTEIVHLPSNLGFGKATVMLRFEGEIT